MRQGLRVTHDRAVAAFVGRLGPALAGVVTVRQFGRGRAAVVVVESAHVERLRAVAVVALVAGLSVDFETAERLALTGWPGGL